MFILSGPIWMAMVQNYIFICQAPPLEMSPEHFTMATIALVLPTTVWLYATEWMTSFTQCISSIHQWLWCSLLHSWCHLKLLSSESPLWWCLFGVGFLTIQQSHVKIRHVEWGEKVWQVCRYSVLICERTEMAFISLSVFCVPTDADFLWWMCIWMLSKPCLLYYCLIWCMCAVALICNMTALVDWELKKRSPHPPAPQQICVQLCVLAKTQLSALVRQEWCHTAWTPARWCKWTWRSLKATNGRRPSSTLTFRPAPKWIEHFVSAWVCVWTVNYDQNLELNQAFCVHMVCVSGIFVEFKAI